MNVDQDENVLKKNGDAIHDQEGTSFLRFWISVLVILFVFVHPLLHVVSLIIFFESIFVYSLKMTYQK